MVLRSANPVGGDAHYQSRGNFRVETLSNSLGKLFSPNDPVILASGDVFLDSYTGASLHILAGGSVTIPGTVNITGPENAANSIVESITLSDNKTILDINGSISSTVDIRAGTIAVGTPLVNTGAPTSANILIGNITFQPIFSDGGRVLLTNQYNPNNSLLGDITLQGSINTSDFLGGGIVAIDSTGKVSLGSQSTPGNILATSFINNGGNITILAKDNIVFNDNSNISTNGLIGGRINLRSNNLTSLSNSTITSISLSPIINTQGGDINISSDSLSLSNSQISTSTFESTNAGNINIKVKDKAIFLNGSQLLSESFGLGNSGNIYVDAVNAEVIFDGINNDNKQILRSGVSTSVSNFRNTTSIIPKGGNISIDAKSLFLTNAAVISTEVFGVGSSGDIFVKTNDSVVLQGNQIVELLTSSGNIVSFLAVPSINTSIQFGSIGNGGNVEVTTKSLMLNNGSQILTSTSGFSNPKINSNAGNIKLNIGKKLDVLGGSQLRSDTFFDGNAGDIDINAINADTVFDGIEIINSIPNRSGVFSSALEFSSGNAGDINITSKSFTLMNNASLSAATSGVGDAGDIVVNVIDNLEITSGSLVRSDTSGLGEAGNIQLSAYSLNLTNNSQLNTLTTGKTKAGDVSINIADTIILSRGFIFSTAESSSSGLGGDIKINTGSIFLDLGSQIATNIFNATQFGKAGDIHIDADNFIHLDNSSGILSTVGTGGTGRGGSIVIESSSLSILNGSQIQAALFREQHGQLGGRGIGGKISVNASDSITLSGISPEGFSSGLLVLSERGAFGLAGDIEVTTDNFQVSDGAIVAAGIFNDGGKGGNITINAQNFKALNGGQILTNTRSSRDAGSIKLNVAESVLIEGSDVNFSNRLNLVRQQLQLSGSSDRLSDVVINEGPNSGLFANTAPNSSGNGGNITIDPTLVILRNGATVAVNSQGFGQGGDINVIVNGLFSATDSTITTSADRSSGGAIFIQAKDIRLIGDSDISTRVGSGAGTGGDIVLTADSIIAFDDSDILAFAQDGRGGDITLNTPAFFGENFFGVVVSGVDPDTLDGNNRVDLNATGQTSGIITVPDVSFIQNNLTELPENLVNPENLLANSCIVRSADQEQGKFIVTGLGGLPERPGNAPLSSFPTGTVHSPKQTTTSPQSDSDPVWQLGEPIVEPQGVYQLENGKLVMSRECSDL